MPHPRGTVPCCQVLFEVAFTGHVVATKNDILRRRDDRITVGRREQVVNRKHALAGFELRRLGQRNVNRHLVAVEVGVESRTDQRVNLDCRSFDQAEPGTPGYRGGAGLGRG